MSRCLQLRHASVSSIAEICLRLLPAQSQDVDMVLLSERDYCMHGGYASLQHAKIFTDDVFCYVGCLIETFNMLCTLFVCHELHVMLTPP